VGSIPIARSRLEALLESLYNVNGLIFWGEREINARKIVESHLVQAVKDSLKSMNRAWEFFQVEAPILTPKPFVNPNYTDVDLFATGGTAKDSDGTDVALIARPETTMGSYVYARYLLNPHNETKVRMPLVVWQHGKSFRREQDQPTKFMRLKEFNQLEFQCIYSPTTAMDYSLKLLADVAIALTKLVGETRITPSDRLPDYSESTIDIEHAESGMELCSCSRRKDFEGAKVLEVAVGTDRVVKHFLGV
jgi:glycyl-tRNA synthetase